jgi:hypothetical protein
MGQDGEDEARIYECGRRVHQSAPPLPQGLALAIAGVGPPFLSPTVAGMQASAHPGPYEGPGADVGWRLAGAHEGDRGHIELRRAGQELRAQFQSQRARTENDSTLYRTHVTRHKQVGYASKYGSLHNCPQMG